MAIVSLTDYVRLNNIHEERCWKSPKTCVDGLTICMWLNIVGPRLGPTNGNGGIITTVANMSVQGFVLFYDTSYQIGVTMATSDKSYMLMDLVGGLGWRHYCVAFMPPSTLESYVNGTPSLSTQFQATMAKSIGNNDIVIGDTYTIPSADKGNIMIDELMIWEKYLDVNGISSLFGLYTPL